MKELMISAALLFASCAFAGETLPLPTAESPVPETMIRESLASLGRAAEFLAKHQAADGSWCGDPAITGLCGLAVFATGDAFQEKQRAGIVAKARKYVLSFAQKDGSIYPADRRRAYPVYSTAICLTFLAELREKEDFEVMRRARQYLIDLQLDEDNADLPTQKGDPKYGGFGYGPGKRGAAHVDLSNSQWVAEALSASEYLTDEMNGGAETERKAADLAWDKLAVFLTGMQHLPETNKSVWVVNDPADPNYGGFIYTQETSRPGPGGPGRPGGKQLESADGGKVDMKTGQSETLRSYGSMTYAGLKSMIYAKVKKDDPRVKAALEWAAKNYTLDENPGMGTSGHYYYLQTFAKAHSVLDSDFVRTPDGSTHNWRLDLLRKFVQVQQGDGSWQNTDNRYMERVPELVTAYSMLSMELGLGTQRSR